MYIKRNQSFLRSFFLLPAFLTFFALGFSPVSYFEGPYIVEADGEIVGEGKLVCFDKVDVGYELQRQFNF